MTATQNRPGTSNDEPTRKLDNAKPFVLSPPKAILGLLLIVALVIGVGWKCYTWGQNAQRSTDNSAAIATAKEFKRTAQLETLKNHQAEETTLLSTIQRELRARAKHDDVSVTDIIVGRDPKTNEIVASWKQNNQSCVAPVLFPKDDQSFYTTESVVAGSDKCTSHNGSSGLGGG